MTLLREREERRKAQEINKQLQEQAKSLEMSAKETAEGKIERNSFVCNVLTAINFVFKFKESSRLLFSHSSSKGKEPKYRTGKATSFSWGRKREATREKPSNWTRKKYDYKTAESAGRWEWIFGMFVLITTFPSTRNSVGVYCKYKEKGIHGYPTHLFHSPHYTFDLFSQRNKFSAVSIEMKKALDEKEKKERMLAEQVCKTNNEKVRSKKESVVVEFLTSVEVWAELRSILLDLRTPKKDAWLCHRMMQILSLNTATITNKFLACIKPLCHEFLSK